MLDSGTPAASRTAAGGYVTTKAKAEGAIEGSLDDYRVSSQPSQPRPTPRCVGSAEEGDQLGAPAPSRCSPSEGAPAPSLQPLAPSHCLLRALPTRPCNCFVSPALSSCSSLLIGMPPLTLSTQVRSGFSTTFRYSRFDAVAAPVRNVSALGGELGPRHAHRRPILGRR